jgi:hypothetical protein
MPAINPGESEQVQVPLWRVTVDASGFWRSDDLPAVTVFPTATVSWRNASGVGREETSRLIEGEGWKPMSLQG